MVVVHGGAWCMVVVKEEEGVESGILEGKELSKTTEVSSVKGFCCIRSKAKEVRRKH